MKQWFRKKRLHPALDTDTLPDERYLELLAGHEAPNTHRGDISHGLQGVTPHVRLRRKPARVKSVSPHLTGVVSGSQNSLNRSQAPGGRQPLSPKTKAAGQDRFSPHVLDLSS